MTHERREAVAAFVSEFYQRHGEPPTTRQIAQAVGVASTSTVDYHLQRLEIAGIVRRGLRGWMPVKRPTPGDGRSHRRGERAS